MLLTGVKSCALLRLCAGWPRRAGTVHKGAARVNETSGYCALLPVPAGVGLGLTQLQLGLRETKAVPSGFFS